MISRLMDSPATGTAFKQESWTPWRSVLKAAFAEPLSEDEHGLFEQLAGGRLPPSERVSELWVVAGRRAAKSHVAALTAVYMAFWGSKEALSNLSVGERGTISVLAVDRTQAKVVFGYICGILEADKTLKGQISRINAESVELVNNVTIEIGTASFRQVRGRSLLCCICDEIAFWRADYSANPDREVIRAALPSLASNRGLLIGISSPYAKSGILYERYREHYGVNSSTLVIQAQTRQLNPTLPIEIIEKAQQEDPEAAKSEWYGEFRSDMCAYVDRSVLEPLTRSSPVEIPRVWGQRYCAFVDPSGGGQGQQADEFTVAIGHMEKGRVVVDCVRGAKGSPEKIVEEFNYLLRGYGVKSVCGDRYAGQWPAEAFKKHGIRYEHSKRTRSELYADSLPLFFNGSVELPPDDILLDQFSALERRTSRSGRDTIDHPINRHDDRANAVAGLICNAGKGDKLVDVPIRFPN